MSILTLSADYMLFGLSLFILSGTIFISYKTNFIQFKFIPTVILMIRNRSREKIKSGHTIAPYKALFTAMSTTLGIGTIVGPVIAIRLGGPGALLGFLLTAFFGSAATYMEVVLSLRFRQKLPSGEVSGGPMQYLNHLISPKAAKWYAIFGSILMSAWSATQANQLASILNSSLLGNWNVPTLVSGLVIAILVFITLVGGIKRVSSFSAKLVPLMFIIYLSSTCYILFSNIDKFGQIFHLIFTSAFSPYALASGSLVGGIVGALRFGIFKGVYATEAGVGTQAIPHSMAETKDPHSQGILGMLSTCTAGVVSFLSGFVALITGTWESADLALGMSMVAASYSLYFSYFGVAMIVLITFLFAFGTILGNSYNGSICFLYLTNPKKLKIYYAATALTIFLGTLLETKTIWTLIDFGLIFLVVPHMIAIMLALYNLAPFAKSKAPLY
jgi:AGCS family alanine or glycine:cation symporter